MSVRIQHTDNQYWFVTFTCFNCSGLGAVGLLASFVSMATEPGGLGAATPGQWADLGLNAGALCVSGEGIPGATFSFAVGVSELYTFFWCDGQSVGQVVEQKLNWLQNYSSPFFK